MICSGLSLSDYIERWCFCNPYCKWRFVIATTVYVFRIFCVKLLCDKNAQVYRKSSTKDLYIGKDNRIPYHTYINSYVTLPAC